MLLFINIYPIICNLIFFLIFLRILFLVIELVEPSYRNAEQGKTIGSHILILLFVFFASGSYKYHFAYEVNDYYSAKSLEMKPDFIERIDSFQLDFQAVLETYSLIDEEKKRKKLGRIPCHRLAPYMRKVNFGISEELYDDLRAIIISRKISEITFCADTTFIYNLGEVHSSEYSSFEDKVHFTTHKLIYNYQGIFKEPFYHKTFVGSIDSIVNPRWKYRIEKHWKYR